MEMGVSRFYATKFARGWPHPVVDSLSWFAIFHLGHAALFEATGLGIVCKPWLCTDSSAGLSGPLW